MCVASALTTLAASLALAREMVKRNRTLAEVTSRATAPSGTPAAAATLERIDVCTLGVKSEMLPATIIEVDRTAVAGASGGGGSGIGGCGGGEAGSEAAETPSAAERCTASAAAPTTINTAPTRQPASRRLREEQRCCLLLDDFAPRRADPPAPEPVLTPAPNCAVLADADGA